jgi:hypothetical protein
LQAILWIALLGFAGSKTCHQSLLYAWRNRPRSACEGVLWLQVEAHLEAEGWQLRGCHRWATAVAAALVVKLLAEQLPLGLQLGLEAAAGLLQEGQGQCWAGQRELMVLVGMGWGTLRGAGFLVAPEPETSFPVLHLHSITYVLNPDPLNHQP